MTGIDFVVYDFLFNANHVADQLGQISSEQLTKAFVAIAVYLIPSMVLGPTLFRRAEIR
jgi:hypothetical protein